MKRREVLKKLRQAAKANALDFDTEEGAKHTRVFIGTGKKSFTVPRHNEINDLLAGEIFKQADAAIEAEKE